MKCRLFSIFLTSFFASIGASAQSPEEDSVSYQTALNNTLAIYFKQTGDQAQIYNGSLYTGYEFKFREGSPYFLSSNFSNGSVVYDGISYDHLPMLYDDLRETVITRDKGYWMQLVNEKIGSFTLLDHQFIRLVMDSIHNSLSGTGFYELLYPGHSMVLKKTTKKIREVLTSNEGALRFIDESYAYFIKNGNAFYRVQTKRGLMDILADHKKEIQQFIRKNRLRFRKDRENAIVKIAAFYDQLKK